jgi:hypothetical protein
MRLTVTGKGAFQPSLWTALAVQLTQTVYYKQESGLGYIELVPRRFAVLLDDLRKAHLLP